MVVVLILSRVMVNDYAITPGDSTLVNPLVSIQGLKTNAHPSKILLTDVEITQLSALTFLIDQFRANTQIVNGSQLTSPGVPISQLDNESYVDMYQSKQFAEDEAFTTLGWKIPSLLNGVLVYGIPSGPETKLLGVGDDVTAVDGSPVHSVCDFTKDIFRDAVGTPVRLTLHPASISAVGAVTYVSKARTVTVKTVALTPGQHASLLCPGLAGTLHSFVDFVFEQSYAYTIPGHVSIDTDNIGGPSAGLAMTLSLIGRLSKTPLAGQAGIAATGTISPGGAVGEVGGIPEKTIAVEHAHAKIFIVPAAQVSQATGANNGTLTILGVTTLAQAMADLRDIGGERPVPLTAPYALRPPP